MVKPTIDMETGALVDQTDAGPSIPIETSLNAGLEQFRANPARRAGILSALSQTISNITGRKALPVAIGGITEDVAVSPGSINVSTAHVEKVLSWERGGAEKGSAALFGDVARAIAKRTGTKAISDSVGAASSVVAELTTDTDLGRSISNSIGSYVSAAPDLGRLIEEFPGLSGAVFASFAMQADSLAPRENFTSKKASDRWRAAWTTMMAEALTPDAVPEGVYPDEETRDRIQAAVAAMRASVDPETGAIDVLGIQQVIHELQPIFDGASDEDNDEDIDSSLDSDGDYQAVPVEERRGPGIGVDLGRHVTVMGRVMGEPVADSPLTAVMREWLIDVRLENTPGQQTGRLNTQLHRVITDRRVFSKRVRITEAPDACVVVAVDFSGSMGQFDSSWTRLNQACKLHDALVYALSDLDIPVASCAYCGRGDNDSHIWPLNLTNQTPVRSAFGMRGKHWVGGNGDVGAMLWSTKQIEQSGAKSGSIVFLADGQVGGQSAQTFRERAKELDVNVFHVDYINAASSPFGGVHIHAASKTVDEIAQPLARGLASALGLDE